MDREEKLRAKVLADLQAQLLAGVKQVLDETLGPVDPRSATILSRIENLIVPEQLGGEWVPLPTEVHIAAFLEECCDRGADYRVGSMALKRAFDLWSYKRDLRNVSAVQLSDLMKTQGFASKLMRVSGSKPMNGYAGVRIKPTART